MEDAGQIRRIAGYKPQRTFVVESLKAIEQLAGDFEVRFHSQPHVYQLNHFFWRANGERRRSDTRNCKIRLDDCIAWRAGALRRRLGRAGLSLPNGQTIATIWT